MQQPCILVVITLGLGFSQAQAVVLEQKFLAGDRVRYQTALQGTVNFQIPADVPFILAGVPLDIEVQGAGTSQIETLAVDSHGTGTLAFELQNADVKAQTLGQNAKWTLKDGKSQVSLNGKPLAVGKEWGAAFKPQSALKVGKDGRIRGVQRIALTPAKVESQAEATPESALDKGALASAMLFRALPALWPQKDVEVGEKWQRTVDFPGAARDDKDGTPLPLGQFEMTLKAQEASLWRVALDGSIDVDGTKLDIAPLKAGEKPRPRFQSATQKVKGTLWFDAQKGQIARAEFVLDSSFKATSPAQTDKKPELTWLDFTGTVEFKREG